jgi:hypothetical protein
MSRRALEALWTAIAKKSMSQAPHTLRLKSFPSDPKKDHLTLFLSKYLKQNPPTRTRRSERRQENSPSQPLGMFVYALTEAVGELRRFAP